MKKIARTIAKEAEKIIVDNKKEYQSRSTKKYHDGDELFANVLLTKQLQYSEQMVLPYLIYNFLAKGNISYVFLTNMYKRFSEFLDTVDITDDNFIALVYHIAESYLEACDRRILTTKNYSNYAFDLYETYFRNCSEFPLFETFTTFLTGDINELETNVLKDIITESKEEGYDSRNIAIFSSRIVDILSQKYEDIRFSEVEELANLLVICGFSLSQSQKIAFIIKNKMADCLARTLEKIFTKGEKKEPNEEKKTELQVSVEEEQRPSKYLSDKEYRKILKEVKKYYNPYSWELTDELLTSEEREHIASLMVRLGLESEQIADFLKKTETVGKTYSYDYFKNHIEEFEYYFGEELNQVFEYMKEIENCTSEEDKEYWIIGIDEELAKLEYSCKLSSYEYEVKLLERK